MLYKYFNKTGESGSVYIGYNHNMMVTPTLAARQIACPHYTRTSDARARVLQPIPATVPALQNTCFLAYPDSAV